ncbi:MAG: DUF3150 domain-containing protein [Limisphaerales bacterium]
MDNQLLNVLTREGVLVNVSVRYWRGCKKLKAEDVGLDPNNVSERLISLGHKRLLPKEATAVLALVEGRTHSLIESNTFPFLNGLAHFLPNTKLAEVTNRLEELKTEFWQAKSEFVGGYAKLRRNAAEEWRQMAEKLVADPERLVTTVEASFPTPDRMDRFFGFDIQLFQIAVPERLGLDLVTVADQQNVAAARQQAAHAAGQQIRQGVEQFVADCAATLREQTAQLCSEMLHSIGSSESGVHQKTLNRLVKFIELFKQLNFVNDHQMEAQLENVRKELLSRSAQEYRDSASARANLVNGLSRLRDQAQTLARQDTTELVQRFGELGRRKFHLAA